MKLIESRVGFHSMSRALLTEGLYMNGIGEINQNQGSRVIDMD